MERTTSNTRKRLSRRECLRLAAGAAGTFLVLPKRALASQKTLRIATWAHFVPQFNTWFDKMAQEWGRQHDTQVRVDHIPSHQIGARAEAEVKSGAGHDLMIFPWPPAVFQQYAI